MLSRVADAVYWMNRYVERAENVARIVDVNLHLQLDLPTSAAEQWAPILAVADVEAPYTAKYGPIANHEDAREKVLHFLTFDEDNPNSILACVRLARENARSVREIISSEMWEQANTFYLMVREAASAGRLAEPHEFFTAVKQASHLFVGISYLTMTHNEAWQFGRVGRLLERADATSRILDVKTLLHLPDLTDIGSPTDEVQWTAILKSASAFEMYRKAHGRIRPKQVAAFLMLDRKFPRAMKYCIVKAERSLHAITGRPVGSYDSVAEQRLGRLRMEFESIDMAEIATRGLHEYLDACQGQLNRVGDAMVDTFFALKPAAVRPHDARAQAR